MSKGPGRVQRDVQRWVVEFGHPGSARQVAEAIYGRPTDSQVSAVRRAMRTLNLDRSPADPQTDNGLLSRALDLSARYLDGRAAPMGVRWVGSRRTFHGTCTPYDETIRLAGQLRRMPQWVIDYVIVHELAHLISEPGHGPDFWALVNRYPKAERARGFLRGYEHAQNRP